MSSVVRDSLKQLRDDPFRREHPFSPDLAEATAALLKAIGDQTAATRIFSSWLGVHQPCLFGRIAARLGGLSYCFLSEADLLETDEVIRQKIQDARRAWRKRAFAGDASGFIILVICEQLARAVPDEVVKRIAKRLCFLYLGDDVEDEILLEDVFLRIPGKEDAEVHWKGGVNYFSAQADGRWWHDHRIPGGLAFSVNSVGHLVRSFQVSRSTEEMWQRLGLSPEEWSNFKVSTLGQALLYAMQTINNASDAISGKATRLLRADRTDSRKLKCPVDLPKNLADRDCSEYFGYYHTDHTLPSLYFRPDVERPAELNGYKLDFTYLFSEGVDNPAFSAMGTGIRVRARKSDTVSRPSDSCRERRRMFGEQGLILNHPELVEALRSA